jgi:hypothetical protein
MIQPTGTRASFLPPVVAPGFGFPPSLLLHIPLPPMECIFPPKDHPTTPHRRPRPPPPTPDLLSLPSAVPCRCTSEEEAVSPRRGLAPAPPPPPGRAAARRRNPRPCKASSTPAGRSSPPPRRVSCRRPTPSRASPPSSVRYKRCFILPRA